MYYPVTLDNLKRVIYDVFLDVHPEFSELHEQKVASPSYLLWMIQEVQDMDISSIDSALKAARWIGWIIAHTEMLVGFSNTESRDWVREDKTNGFDKPH